MPYTAPRQNRELWQAYRTSFDFFAREAGGSQGSEAQLEQARIAHTQARNELVEVLLEKQEKRKTNRA